jgi:hypothetical protein
MPSIDTSVEFEVICARCGAGLCNNSDVRYSRQRGMAQVTVEPCQHCLDIEHDEGYKEGIADMED